MKFSGKGLRYGSVGKGEAGRKRFYLLSNMVGQRPASAVCGARSAKQIGCMQCWAALGRNCRVYALDEDLILA